MTKIQRYDIDVDDFALHGLGVSSCEDGDWVKWDDVEALVKEVREECAVLSWATGMSAYKGYKEDPREIGSLIAEIIRKLNK